MFYICIVMYLNATLHSTIRVLSCGSSTLSKRRMIWQARSSAVIADLNIAQRLDRQRKKMVSRAMKNVANVVSRPFTSTTILLLYMVTLRHLFRYHFVVMLIRKTDGITDCKTINDHIKVILSCLNLWWKGILWQRYTICNVHNHDNVLISCNVFISLD